MLQLSVIEVDQALHLFRAGRQAVLRLARTEDALQVSAGAEEGSLLTPLPGTVVAVHVTTGEQVARGAPLVTVEAMKMEHTLTAPYDGRVARVALGLAGRGAAGRRRGGAGARCATTESCLGSESRGPAKLPAQSDRRLRARSAVPGTFRCRAALRPAPSPGSC